MPKVSLAQLNTVVQGDTAASAGSLALRDNGGGLTLGPSTIAGLTLTGPLAESVQVLSANGTIAATTTTVQANSTSAAITLNLPAAAAYANQTLKLIRTNAGANNVTYAAAGSDTILNGTTSTTLVQTTQGAFSLAYSDGTTWYIK